jgi:hypothetical protein
MQYLFRINNLSNSTLYKLLLTLPFSPVLQGSYHIQLTPPQTRTTETSQRYSDIIALSSNSNETEQDCLEQIKNVVVVKRARYNSWKLEFHCCYSQRAVGRR